MGLDQYAYEQLPSTENVESNDPIEIAYWRKHAALHNWFNGLYLKQGNVLTDDFNGIEVKISLEELDELETVVKAKKLQYVDGFFFGTDSSEEYYEDDLKFITKARESIKEGNTVFYNSWW